MYQSALKYNRIKTFLLSAYFKQHSCIISDWLIKSCARLSDSFFSCARDK